MVKHWLPTIKIQLSVAAGILIIISSTILFFFVDPLIDHIIKKELILKPDSNTFYLWRDTPIPMFMNFYFFNWTNPDELGKVKPNLEQIGPYRFNMKEDKTDIQWNDNGTISFKIARRWHHDSSRSKGSLNDTITTLNAVAMSAAHTVRNWNTLLKKSVSLSLETTGQDVFIRQQVGDLLFNGYSDPLLKIAGTLPSFAGIHIPYDKFGWFYMRNTSSNFEGEFNMDTGERGISDFGRIWRWNNDIETGFYSGSCGRVYGSAGELFPPHQLKEKPLHMFSADLCRTIRLDFNEEVTVSKIPGYKYVGGPWNVDNGTLDPANSCFCGGECPPIGALNVTSCRFGAPGFVSYPHFLFGDSYYSNAVQGIDPHPSKHSLFITLEPRTGIPLEVAARFQINILLSSVKGVGMFDDVPKIYFPMMWFEQRAGISSSLAEELKLLLQLPYIIKVSSVVGIVIGCAILMFSICLSIPPKQKVKIAYNGQEAALIGTVGNPLLQKSQASNSLY